MTKTFIRKIGQRDEELVEYKVVLDNGTFKIYACSLNEWEVIELREKILKTGIDKKLLEDFEWAIRAVEEQQEQERINYKDY